MIIKSLKISNILSYKLLENFDEAPNTIEFNDDLNILIGSNGSGKSNLLEIINKLFQSYFFEYYYINDNALHNNRNNEKVVKANKERRNQVNNTLFKHFHYQNETSKLQIGITLDKGDIENLLNIHSNANIFKKYFHQYCENNDLIDYLIRFTEDEIKNLPIVEFKFTINNSQEVGKIEFQLYGGNDKKEEHLIYFYLLYFNQIQTLIEVINLYEKITFPLLKNPFALISSMRQYGGFANSINVGTGLNQQIKDADHGEANSSTKNYVGTDYIFRITSIKLGQLFRRFRDNKGVDGAFETIFDSENIFTKISSLLEKNLSFTLKLENYNNGNDTMMLNIYKDSEIINFTDLSMGQKSIFYLLFAVYGYDIQNGLLIIDEPELHLHVTMQKKYFSILKEICKEANIQILIVTHSSIFINENTIKNTFRFFQNNNHTSIICPSVVSQPQKDLIKILTYTNTSRIFFSDYVVLVEGDSDEYFFSYLYENYIKEKIKSKIEIEILYIGGKGNFKKWREFLELFKINTFFIGDFDNIKEFEILSKAGIDFQLLSENAKGHIISKFHNEKISKKVTQDGKELLRQLDLIVKNNFKLDESHKNNLTSLWIYLIEKQGVKRSYIVDYLNSQVDKSQYNRILREIEKLYDQGIFILKNGDLEDYLSLSKDLSNVISFCQNDFQDWIKSQESLGDSSKLNELIEIFKKILTTN